MLELIVYLLISIGCSCLWSLADVFIPARNFVAKKVPNPIKKMLLCMECSSFWIGLVVAFMFCPFPDLRIPFYLCPIFCGIITHLCVRLLNKHEILL